MIKRYSISYDSKEENHAGDWCAASDVAALEARCQRFEAALRKIENNDMRYDLTACAQIAREALETLPAGYRNIADVIANAEKDPKKKAALDAARARLTAKETK